MNPALAAFVMAWLLLSGAAHAAEVEGVVLQDRVRLQADGPELLLNGAGLRTRLFFRIYVGALYLAKPSASAQGILADAGPKRVAMHMLRDLGSDQLFSSLREGLEKNHSPEQVARFAPQVRQLEKIFQSISTAKVRDLFLLDYLPGVGTRVLVNGIEKGILPGAGFNRALLRIWLGEQPADEDLKKAMLGN